jgi:hypothetical protein
MDWEDAPPSPALHSLFPSFFSPALPFAGSLPALSHPLSQAVPRSCMPPQIIALAAMICFVLFWSS